MGGQYTPAPPPVPTTTDYGSYRDRPMAPMYKAALPHEVHWWRDLNECDMRVVIADAHRNIIAEFQDAERGFPSDLLITQIMMVCG